MTQSLTVTALHFLLHTQLFNTFFFSLIRTFCSVIIGVQRRPRYVKGEPGCQQLNQTVKRSAQRSDKKLAVTVFLQTTSEQFYKVSHIILHSQYMHINWKPCQEMEGVCRLLAAGGFHKTTGYLYRIYRDIFQLCWWKQKKKEMLCLNVSTFEVFFFFLRRTWDTQCVMVWWGLRPMYN